MALPKQILNLPLAAGLAQKSDSRARSAPFLDIANDVQFDEVGGLQTRYPFAPLFTSMAIFGGGTVTNPRRIFEFGGELLLFSDDTLYSWNAQLEVWVEKGTHLAVAIGENPVFVDTGEQRECDRAELDGTIVYAWSEPTGSKYGGQVRVAAMDKATGSVLMPPTTCVDAGGAKMPRLVALDTKILLLYVQIAGSNVKFKRLDPAAPLAGVTGGSSPVYTSGISSVLESYDVERIPGEDVALAVVASDTTGEGTILMRIPATGATTVRLVGRLNGSDTFDVKRVAIAVSADGGAALVVREGGGTVEADFIDPSDLSDGAHINILLGSTAAHSGAAFITAAHSPAAGRWSIWWADDLTESDDDFVTTFNYVDAATGVAGSAAGFVHRLCPASRAFRYGDNTFVWLVFGGFLDDDNQGALQLQSSYFLYRDDGLLVAKAVTSRAGGLSQSGGDPRGGVLPGVQLVDGSTGYAWCGIERRVFVSGERSNYADRGPRDITFTFDSNEARRCVQLGETLYITGGELLQYDGQQLCEVGFHIYPWAFSVAQDGAGDVELGTYTYKSTLRWQNARGEVERSTTAELLNIEVTGASQQISVVGVPLHVTHKTVNPPAAEFWRTAVNPPDDAPFFLVSSKDPSEDTNPNRYIANDSEADVNDELIDNLADEDLSGHEQSDEIGAVLERLAPPPATLIAASADRLFIAGIPGDPDRVWYSRLRGEGEVASFHDALTIQVPKPGGRITALAVRDDMLLVFRETAIYAFPGSGFDNTANGANFGPDRRISETCGAINQESVMADTAVGVVFKSRKGWYLIRGLTPEYIGAPVASYDDETPLAVHLVEKQHQVRILTSSRLLVWDYLVNQWAEWSVSNGVHACLWDGEHVYLSTTGPKKQSATYEDLDYGLDIETAWIKPADLQGAARVYKLQPLGEVRSTDLTHVRIRIKYDYVETYVDDEYWPVSPAEIGAPLQVKIGPRYEQVQAIKIRLTAIRRYTEEQFVDDVPVTVTINGAPTGEALKLTGLGVEVGVKPPGLYNRLPPTQRS